MEKTFKVDRYELAVIPERNQFKTPLREKLTEEEQCLVDNIWSLSTIAQSSGRKATCVNYLIQLLVSGRHKTKKPFTCYALYTGKNAGLYLTWEEMITELEELKKDPKSGNPLYKGYYSIEEATSMLTQKFGNDFVVSEQILRYKEYLKHLDQFSDQELLKNLETGASSSVKLQRFEPQTPKKKLENTFSEVMKTSLKLKEKEIPTLGKIPAPVTSLKSITSPSLNKNPVCPGECSLKTFVLLQECLAQLANSGISTPGISISWDFNYNLYKTCSLQYPDCPENQQSDDFECLCKLEFAIRKARLLIPGFKPFKFQDYPVNFSTLLKHGLVKSANISPLHEFSGILPEMLAETFETIIPEFPKKFRLDFTSLYPDFKENKPAYHLLEVNFQKVDDEYKDFEAEHQHPRALKLEETMEIQLDQARAKILAENFNWTKFKFANKNILREDSQGKIYCDPSIGSRYFFPFEITHPNPRLVNSYKRRIRRILPRTLSSSESEDMNIS
ncbi:uncharacterized protein LOC116016068 [Ipomoea triloba]|uniref:uncharacterized protein LOC116016068 n=1 Tax=Ipomoea triloba TaxID=35885 RepID=UPI00125CE5C2|nr:uncharacterized protein LOC116016068 [Ipomoea triloba]